MVIIVIMTIQRMMMMMTKSLALSVVITLQECGLSWAQGVNCRTYSVYWTFELDTIGKYYRILMYTCIINTQILFEVFGQERAHATVKIHKTCHIHKRSNICHLIFVQEFPELNELLCSLWTKNCYWNQKLPKQCRREVSWIPSFVSGIFHCPVSSVQPSVSSTWERGRGWLVWTINWIFKRALFKTLFLFSKNNIRAEIGFHPCQQLRVPNAHQSIPWKWKNFQFVKKIERVKNWAL